MPSLASHAKRRVSSRSRARLGASDDSEADKGSETKGTLQTLLLHMRSTDQQTTITCELVRNAGSRAHTSPSESLPAFLTRSPVICMPLVLPDDKGTQEEPGACRSTGPQQWVGKGREDAEQAGPCPQVRVRLSPSAALLGQSLNVYILTGDVNYTFRGTVSMKPPAYGKPAVDFLSIRHQTPMWRGCLNPATWRWISIWERKGAQTREE